MDTTWGNFRFQRRIFTRFALTWWPDLSSTVCLRTGTQHTNPWHGSLWHCWMEGTSLLEKPMEEEDKKLLGDGMESREVG